MIASGLILSQRSVKFPVHIGSPGPQSGKNYARNQENGSKKQTTAIIGSKRREDAIISEGRAVLRTSMGDCHSKI